MELNIDIGQLATEALEKALQPDLLREKINGLVQSSVDSALKDAFRPYSAFYKSLEETVAATIPHAAGDNFNRMAEIVQKVVSCQINKINDERVEQAVLPAIQKLLAPTPAEVNLSSLVANAVECWREDYNRKGAARPTIIVSESSSTPGYWHIAMDPEEGQQEYACRVRIAITHDGEAYSVKIADTDVKRAFYAGQFFNFDRLLFNLYSGGSKIIIDKTDFSNVYYDGDED